MKIRSISAISADNFEKCNSNHCSNPLIYIKLVKMRIAVTGFTTGDFSVSWKCPRNPLRA